MTMSCDSLLAKALGISRLFSHLSVLLRLCFLYQGLRRGNIRHMSWLAFCEYKDVRAKINIFSSASTQSG